MDSSIFPTSAFGALLALLRTRGVLEALVSGLVAIGIGVTYVRLRSGITDGASFEPRSLLTTGARLTLGGVFLVFGGINGFFQLVPEHPSSLRQACDACRPFLEGIASAGYLFPLVKATELVGGALLVTGFLAPLGLILLAPLVVNIFLYHATMNPNGLLLAGTLAALQLYLAFHYRASFASLFQPRAVPVSASRTGRAAPTPTPNAGLAPARRSS
jgi:uncharacterized membrane protein YphA (DoxX/SURF4 family)